MKLLGIQRHLFQDFFEVIRRASIDVSFEGFLRHEDADGRLTIPRFRRRMKDWSTDF